VICSKNSFIKGVFCLPVRVYIEDTDAGGIVFYGNYLKYFERSRTEYVRSLGVSLRAGLIDNLSFVVSNIAVDYIKPAKLDDMLFVATAVTNAGPASMKFSQKVFKCSNEQWDMYNASPSAYDENDLEILCTADVRVAALALDTMKPCRLPVVLKAALIEKLNN
jgi:acyl-CoA thioester hydrolase